MSDPGGRLQIMKVLPLKWGDINIVASRLKGPQRKYLWILLNNYYFTTIQSFKSVRPFAG